MIRAGSWE